MKKKSLTVGEVVRALEARAPSACGEEWDNVGLLVGRPSSRISSAVVSVDLSVRALELALKRKANLIVNHHPCIFPRSRGLPKITDSSSREPNLQSLIVRALENGISIVASHTNFDQC